MRPTRCVLSLNVGSSSLKFGAYEHETLRLRVRGKVERIGSSATTLVLSGGEVRQDCGGLNHWASAAMVLNWLDERIGLTSVAAIGHRLVHGGRTYREPQVVTADVMADLRKISTLAPEHLPRQIDMLDLARNRLPDVPQVACFDTMFHRDMPRVAKLLPVPRRFQATGIERFGFHGLSCEFLLEELRTPSGTGGVGRAILAHLGHGCSLTAVLDGKSMDTTMGFTPAGGVPMSTRSGDLDPGVMSHLVKQDGMTADEFDRMANHESGLLGVSETTGDVHELLSREPVDQRAADAIALFCYHVKKAIGALAAALGGLDILVFTGGIGENAPTIRARICEGLSFLGVSLDPANNARGIGVIAAANSTVDVRVIRTDEEMMIARHVMHYLRRSPPSHHR